MLRDTVVQIDHLGVVTSDIQETSNWYINMLGFEKIHEKIVLHPYRLDLVFLKLKNCTIELIQSSGIDRKAVDERIGGSLDHYALAAPDFSYCEQKIRSNGAIYDDSTKNGKVTYEHIGPQGVTCVNFQGAAKEVVELTYDPAKQYGNLSGLQGWSHLALKVFDLNQSTAFYETLGFIKSNTGFIDTAEGRIEIVFLALKEFELELIQPVGKEREMLSLRKSGAIDHVAFTVSDIQQAFVDAKKEGYKMLDVMLQELPLFESGVKFFMIEGPSGEHIEFTKKNY